MSRSALELPWARHSQPIWKRRASDERLDQWMRVAFLAFGTHGENGHSTFGRGDIATILGKPGKPYRNVKRAIEQAVEMGWLARGSYWGCLVVPPEAIKAGDLHSSPTCQRCARRARRGVPESTRRVDLGRPKSTPRVDVGVPKSTPSVATEREPLLSLCTPQPDNNMDEGAA